MAPLCPALRRPASGGGRRTLWAPAYGWSARIHEKNGRQRFTINGLQLLLR
jgi:hypothetical protein